MPTWWTTPQSGNLVLPFHDNSGLSWTVSAPAKAIAVPVERHGVLQTVLLWWDPNDVPHRRILPSYEAEWWSVSTLLMMPLLPGWPTMGLNRIRKKKNYNVLIGVTLSQKCCRLRYHISVVFNVYLSKWSLLHNLLTAWVNRTTVQLSNAVANIRWTRDAACGHTATPVSHVHKHLPLVKENALRYCYYVGICVIDMF